MVKTGSPPHTRGKVKKVVFLCVSTRITPAHAGKRGFCRRPCRRSTDHPRTRGEKFHPAGLTEIPVGSPPHTRGKAYAALNYTFQPRITPAHAGKSPNSSQGLKKAQDHPRTRGEKHKHIYPDKSEWGSPPHTRGKAAEWAPFSEAWRITPAHAGKRDDAMIYTLEGKDHPRTRGEKRPVCSATW